MIWVWLVPDLNTEFNKQVEIMNIEKSLQESTKQALTIPVVVCSACGAENSIRWDKHFIGIDDKQGSYKDLSFQFCEECGDTTNVDFS
jgi:transcription elongation factor Elf1